MTCDHEAAAVARSAHSGAPTSVRCPDCGTEWMTTRQLVDHFRASGIDVTAVMVEDWRRRGVLTPVPGRAGAGPRAQYVYRLADAYAAEAATRDTGRRRGNLKGQP